MEKYTSPEQTLTEIRQLMERSSRFISLSGLSGILAGIYALLGAAVAYYYLHMQPVQELAATAIDDSIFVLASIAAIVLVLAVSTGILLTTRKARKDGHSLLDAAAKKLLINLSIPLVTGGVFCLGALYHGNGIYVAPAMLIFYGLALVHASKYTRDDIRSLGLSEVVLGLSSLFFAGYGLFFWAMGFGVLHIVYGTHMYLKYEK